VRHLGDVGLAAAGLLVLAVPLVRRAPTGEALTESAAVRLEGKPATTERRPAGRPGEIQAEPPPLSDGIFPCTQCHDGPGEVARRELGAHEEVQSAFDHDSENRWCLDCHDNQDRDVLRLASGAPVPFTESYRLCGQCHGDKYRDWRAGIHGRRSGWWDGARTYELCVHCHDPHSPRFKAIEPEAPPHRPREMRR
jgi:hypothetical protein